MADRDLDALDLGGAVPRIQCTLSCKAYMPRTMYERRPPLVLSGSLPPEAVLCPAMKAPASPFGAKPRSLRP